MPHIWIHIIFGTGNTAPLYEEQNFTEDRKNPAFTNWAVLEKGVNSREELAEHSMTAMQMALRRQLHHVMGCIPVNLLKWELTDIHLANGSSPLP